MSTWCLHKAFNHVFSRYIHDKYKLIRFYLIRNDSMVERMMLLYCRRLPTIRYRQKINCKYVMCLWLYYLRPLYCISRPCSLCILLQRPFSCTTMEWVKIYERYFLLPGSAELLINHPEISWQFISNELWNIHFVKALWKGEPPDVSFTVPKMLELPTEHLRLLRIWIIGGNMCVCNFSRMAH